MKRGDFGSKIDPKPSPQWGNQRENLERENYDMEGRGKIAHVKFLTYKTYKKKKRIKIFIGLI